MQLFVDFCRALANERRVSMFILIQKQMEMSVCELADAFGITEQAASFHLKKLLKVGLVRQRRDGKYTLSISHNASQTFN
jgi:DNA-binding transcriptional ArsR family regulator